jgi:hypothetical protein
MTGHVQSASGKFLVPPLIVLTAIWFPVRVQVDAAQSAKYPWQNRKPGIASEAPPARAVCGAYTRSTAVSQNTTIESVFLLTPRGVLCISVPPFLRSFFTLILYHFNAYVEFFLE